MKLMIDGFIFILLVLMTWVALVEFRPLAAWSFVIIVWAVYLGSLIDFDDSGSS